MPQVTELFQTLVKIDSVSGNEKLVSDYVFQFLLNHNLKPYQDEHMMIHCKVTDNPQMLFCAHMDTVEPGVNIVPIVEDGYIKSAGSTILGADNKASLSAILSSLEYLISQNIYPDVELLFSVREETNSGIKDFDVSRIKSKFGFVFDCGHGDLGKVVKNCARLEDFSIKIIGKPSHASMPEEGKNVLEALNTFLNKVKVGRIDEFTTFNVGIISGGTSTNTIPAELTLFGDLRSLDMKSFNHHKDLIIDTLNQVNAKGYEVTHNFDVYSTGYNLDLENSFFEKVRRIYSEYDIQVDPIITTSGSDADFLNNNGIQTYCMGDGAELVHTTDEKISVEKLNNFSKIIAKLMQLQIKF